MSDSKIHAPGGLDLGWNALHTTYPDDANHCYLVALNSRQLSVLHDLVGLTKWYWLWGIERSDHPGRNAVLEFKAELEACLMSGCRVEDLIKTQRMLVAAIAGQHVDLATDLPDSVDFSNNGVSPRLNQQNTSLGNIRSQMQDGQNQQHADMTSVVSQLINIGHQIERLADDEEGEALAEKIQLVADMTQALAEVVGAIIPSG